MPPAMRHTARPPPPTLPQAPANALLAARRNQMLIMLDRGTLKLSKACTQLQQVRACTPGVC